MIEEMQARNNFEFHMRRNEIGQARTWKKILKLNGWND